VAASTNQASTSARSPSRDRKALRDNLGARLRKAREEKNIGLRELARRVGVSHSLISQIETGKSEPTISTLYSIVSELDLPVNEIVWDSAETRSGRGPAETPTDRGGGASRTASRSSGPGIVSPVQGPRDRRTIQLESGVKWDRLTAQPDHDVDFLLLRYPPGSESTAPESLMRHNGREYGYVLSGRLQVTLGFDEWEVGPGSSIAFDCTQPHRLANVGSEPVEAVWMVIGRRHSPPEGESRPSTP
jgi:transcriptional regulator with XRE-family HTH domain/mannose-6-phosphate isomerase-like protein (cupin superfamily)